jgi:hypothetical protein
LPSSEYFLKHETLCRYFHIKSTVQNLGTASSNSEFPQGSTSYPLRVEDEVRSCGAKLHFLTSQKENKFMLCLSILWNILINVFPRRDCNKKDQVLGLEVHSAKSSYLRDGVRRI